MRTLSDLQRMAARTGCTLVAVRQIGGELVGRFECPDIEEGRPLTTATLLEGLTDEDLSLDSFDPSVLATLRSAGSLAPAFALAYVQQHVEFRDEDVETFQSPSATLRLGYGDCDDSARALVGLAGAIGIPGRLVFFLKDGQPAHVTSQLYSGGRWQWAETTIPARYGEHPFAALKRLRIRRSDLDGSPFVLQNGRAVPLTSTPPKPKGSSMRLADLASPSTAGMRALGALVPRVATPVTAQSLANALAAAWPTAIGGSSGSAIPVLVAQSAFETGAWAAMWNNNIGNVKTSTSGSTDYFSMTASEGSGASATMQASLWRSYPTLEDGAAGYLAFLNNNYGSALQAAEQGDVAGFVAALKAGGYFTGDLDQYTAGVQTYYAQYRSLSPSSIAGKASSLAQNASNLLDDPSSAFGFGSGGGGDGSGGTALPETLGAIALGALGGIALGFFV